MKGDSCMDSLKQLRSDLNLSQEKMAQKIGVTLSYYQKIEQGNVMAAAGFIRKFKKAFPHVSTEIFFQDGR